MTLKEAALIVLGHRGDHRAAEPGGFYSALLDAWVRADRENRERLSQGFPVLGVCMTIVQEHGDDTLADVAGL